MAKRSRKIDRFAVFDCETDPFFYTTDIKPFIWAFFDGEKVDFFSKTSELVSRIRDFAGHCYAHNGGKFDSLFLLPHLLKEDGGQQITVINGRLAKFKIGESTIFDSYNILPVPQAQMTKDEFQYWKMHKVHRAKYKEQIRHYLEKDVTGLYPWIKAFRETYGHNLTLASAAFKTFYKMRPDIKPPKTDQNYFEFFKKFYFGGRVSCFRSGVIKEPFEIYDINSAYPTAMLQPHPFGSEFIETNRPDEEELKRALVTVRCHSAGALPFRHKTGVDFPHGRGVFHITGWEYLTAKRCKLIKDDKIETAYVFSEVDNFSTYVNHFYAIKKNADKADPNRLFAKLLLNSLYGKYCANPANYSEVMIQERNLHPDAMENLFNRGFENSINYGSVSLWEKPLDPEKGRYYNIVTGASITGYQRATLLESLQGVDGPIYCDTDSIICRDGSGLRQGKELGDWAKEGAGTEIAVAGKKLYAAKLDIYDPDKKKWKIASKGAKLTAAQIFEVAQGETVRWTNLAPSFSVNSQPKIISRNIKNTVDNGLADMRELEPS